MRGQESVGNPGIRPRLSSAPARICISLRVEAPPSETSAPTPRSPLAGGSRGDHAPDASDSRARSESRGVRRMAIIPSCAQESALGASGGCQAANWLAGEPVALECRSWPSSTRAGFGALGPPPELPSWLAAWLGCPAARPVARAWRPAGSPPRVPGRPGLSSSPRRVGPGSGLAAEARAWICRMCVSRPFWWLDSTASCAGNKVTPAKRLECASHGHDSCGLGPRFVMLVMLAANATMTRLIVLSY